MSLFVDYPSVAGARVVHALQGGGTGLKGKWIAGVTWCGVEHRTTVHLAPSMEPVTCKLCLHRMAAEGQAPEPSRVKEAICDHSSSQRLQSSRSQRRRPQNRTPAGTPTAAPSTTSGRAPGSPWTEGSASESSSSTTDRSLRSEAAR